MMDLGICIVSHDKKDLLGVCLESIYKGTERLIFRVCVLDNCSRDGSADMVQREFPQVTLLRGKRRRGFVANQNEMLALCVQHCRGNSLCQTTEPDSTRVKKDKSLYRGCRGLCCSDGCESCSEICF